MNVRSSVLLTVMVIVSTAGLSATVKASWDSPEYTGAQIRKMAREAHTVKQYTELADYYATRRRLFKRKAAEEMHIWAERSATITPLSEKWPRPVDSARNLHDYYEYKADEAGALQAKYGKLADNVAMEQSSLAEANKR